MYNLDRFIQAQAYNYNDALREIRSGRKQSCWMWYVFPQIRGLGRSSMARTYELESIEEAKEYLAHPILGARLQEICEAALQTESDNAGMVFGFPDDMKLRYSMTLFEQADPENPIYGKLLDKFFHGNRDEMTLRILKEQLEGEMAYEDAVEITYRAIHTGMKFPRGYYRFQAE